MKLYKRSSFLGLGAAVCATVLSACGKTQQESNSSKETKKNIPAYDEKGTLTEPIPGDYTEGLHTAEIVIQDKGSIQLQLNATIAPITVSNFADLCSHEFYDGLTFHRIIKDFMAQGGDPKGDGTGGAARTIKGEFSQNGVVNTISHKRGTISMARSSAVNSASSQFFIMQKDNPSLDGQYAAFGEVTSGIEIIDDLCNNTAVTDDNGTVAKDAQPKIVSIRMTS